MADSSREVYVFVGDGTYLMMPSEIVTAIQEGIKLIIVVVDNHGFASIGGLSNSLGSAGFGTRFRMRGSQSGQLDGEYLPVDYETNARSLGAEAVSVDTIADFKIALKNARKATTTSVVVIRTDRDVRVPGYDSWWDVAVAQVSSLESVQKAHLDYEEARKKEKFFL
jgi:3D-(3,5/4)-trihydroxycyclohexane-1,2-dione acylhydrolase (decyclizing)